MCAGFNIDAGPNNGFTAHQTLPEPRGGNSDARRAQLKADGDAHEHGSGKTNSRLDR